MKSSGSSSDLDEKGSIKSSTSQRSFKDFFSFKKDNRKADSQPLPRPAATNRPKVVPIKQKEKVTTASPLYENGTSANPNETPVNEESKVTLKPLPTSLDISKDNPIKPLKNDPLSPRTKEVGNKKKLSTIPSDNSDPPESDSQQSLNQSLNQSSSSEMSKKKGKQKYQLPEKTLSNGSQISEDTS